MSQSLENTLALTEQQSTQLKQQPVWKAVMKKTLKKVLLWHLSFFQIANV